MDTRIKILLIDEEHAKYSLVGGLLAQIDHTDYQLTWCDGQGAALTEILSGHYDVILLDYHCGRGLLGAARARGCRVPVVVMTDEMEAEVDREAIREGASDYLIKGRINAQLLERTVRYAIERKAAELKLTRLAHFDPLTNIPNRVLFRDRLEHAIELADRDRQPFALMYLDLDGFKQVNDNFGHDVGDALICAFAERLLACMRRSDSVARIGGDEFTLLIEHTENTGDIAHIAEKVLEVVTRPYQVGRHQVMVGCSMGIAVYPETGSNAETLMKNADMAMYQAKLEVGCCYRFYTEAMNVEARRQLLLESELRRALRRDEFSLYYQPRIDLVSGDIVGLEALVRWRNPQRGLVLPEEFIAVAEETGLIVPLGYWVIHRACKDLQLMHSAELPAVVMSINLSLRQLNDDKLVERVAGILRETGVRGDELEFELTETAVMENRELVSLCMRALSQLRASFSLDDFGTGYSSFLHLQRLPIATMKIDNRFIADIATNSEGATLVTAMINLAHSLDKQIVAEGVEDEEQLHFLRQRGCDQVQGYLLGRPMDFNEVCLKLEQESMALTLQA